MTGYNESIHEWCTREKGCLGCACMSCGSAVLRLKRHCTARGANVSDGIGRQYDVPVYSSFGSIQIGLELPACLSRIAMVVVLSR